MSGGSYDYAFTRVDEFAANLRHVNTNPRRAAFKDLCERVAKAMHDIEWVDSCDYGPDGEVEAIDKALGTNAPSIVLAKAIELAIEERGRLSIAIDDGKRALEQQ